jgi:4-hydroxy-tetrahydrodipicolinate synthase
MAHPNGFQGTGTALATPFRSWEVDVEALRRLVNDQIAGGIDVLVPCGTTGEAVTLTREEWTLVVRTVVEEARGRVPVVAGCGSNSTRTTIENVRYAKELGVNGALVVTPPYNKPQQEGLFLHYSAVAREGGIPIMLYNVPGRTSVDLQAETVARLAKVPGIVGIKEASGQITRIIDILEYLDGTPFDIIAGDDGFTLPVVALGGDGVQRGAREGERHLQVVQEGRRQGSRRGAGCAPAARARALHGDQPGAGEGRARDARQDDRRGPPPARARQRGHACEAQGRAAGPGRERLGSEWGAGS